MTDLIAIHNDKGLLSLDGDYVVIRHEIAARIADFERQVKVINEQEKALKAAILEEMEEIGIVKMDTPEVSFTYIAETDRESLDSKALKAELPDVYNAFCKISSVKPSVRIKVK